jgi:hypothetical protein
MRILMNAEICNKDRGLALLREEFLEAERKVKKRTGECRDCSIAEPEFSGIRAKIISKFRSLPPKSIELLKAHLIATKLTFFTKNSVGNIIKEHI